MRASGLDLNTCLFSPCTRWLQTDVPSTIMFVYDFWFIGQQEQTILIYRMFNIFILLLFSARLLVWLQWSPQCDLISTTWTSMSETPQPGPLPWWPLPLVFPRSCLSSKPCVRARSPGRPDTQESRLSSRLPSSWAAPSCLTSAVWWRLSNTVSQGHILWCLQIFVVVITNAF